MVQGDPFQHVSLEPWRGSGDKRGKPLARIVMTLTLQPHTLSLRDPPPNYHKIKENFVQDKSLYPNRGDQTTKKEGLQGD